MSATRREQKEEAPLKWEEDPSTGRFFYTSIDNRGKKRRVYYDELEVHDIPPQTGLDQDPRKPRYAEPATTTTRPSDIGRKPKHTGSSKSNPPKTQDKTSSRSKTSRRHSDKEYHKDQGYGQSKRGESSRSTDRGAHVPEPDTIAESSGQASGTYNESNAGLDSSTYQQPYTPQESSDQEVETLASDIGELTVKELEKDVQYALSNSERSTPRPPIEDNDGSEQTRYDPARFDPSQHASSQHASSQYNSNQYTSDQYTSDQYTSGQYTSGQYTSGQYTSGQYTSNQQTSSQYPSSQDQPEQYAPLPDAAQYDVLNSEAPIRYPSTLQSRHIGGTAGDTEPLDPSYRVRNTDFRKFFRPGRVFCTLWTAPAGDITKLAADSQFMSVVSHNEWVHSKIRRFVVVRQGERCCVCLPVTTYGGNGYKKPGINLSEHGLIYSSKKCPSGAQGITKQPLLVKLAPKGDRLVNPSYINYGRPYTIDTNVKVKDVGDLDSTSRGLLRRYYNEINIAMDDDDIEGKYTAQQPHSRAADLAGMGSGIQAPSYSSYQTQGYEQPSPNHGANAFSAVGYAPVTYTWPSSASATGHHGQTTYAGHQPYGAGHVLQGANATFSPTSSSSYQYFDSRASQPSSAFPNSSQQNSLYTSPQLYETSSGTQGTRNLASISKYSSPALAPGTYESHLATDNSESEPQSYQTSSSLVDTIVDDGGSSSQTQFTSTLPQSTQNPLPSPNQELGEELEEIDLPDLQEVQASRRHRRDSSSTTSRRITGSKYKRRT